MYYLESYIASDIEDVNKLLGQKVYSQELLNLNDDSIMKEINGIKVVDSLSLLDDADKLRIVRKNILD